MRSALILVALVGLAGCGGGTPSGPSPQPSPITLHGTITDTVSGASIGVLSQTVSSLPARVTVSAAGHLDRSLLITSAAPTVDLIPDAAPFDLTFYRQFARGALEGPVDQLRVLAQAPSIYLQRTGLSDANVAALERAARDVIPALTGGRFQLVAWEVGNELRADANGWITVEAVNDDAQPCGRTSLGASVGHMWLNIASRCSFQGNRVDPPLFAHEVGHGLGFSHVGDTGHLMHSRATFSERRSTLPSDAERYHAAIAYHRAAGNMDVDRD